MKLFKKIIKMIGPGIITGAADDDPSGIATYSQAGAQFGYGFLWTALYILPMQVAVQEACARIGAVTGKGLSGVIKEHYSTKILFFLIILTCLANVINIAADIGAMAAAVNLLIPINETILTVFFIIVMITLEIVMSYKVYVNVLKWLVLALLCYPITLLLANTSWQFILKATLIPQFQYNYEYWFILTGLLGTTISPYLFFWQASEEVEEEHVKQIPTKLGRPIISRRFIKKLDLENFFGMFFSQFCAWAIIALGGTVLHQNGIININSAADAAKALQPLMQNIPHGGIIAKMLFAIGIIGLGLLSIPVLAGSSAYALAEACQWKCGLDLKWHQAKAFYLVIMISTALGILINFVPIDPFKVLIYAAVINGISSVPLILIISLIAQNKKIMGRYKVKWLSKSILWFTLLTTAIATGLMMYHYLMPLK